MGLGYDGMIYLLLGLGQCGLDIGRDGLDWMDGCTD